MRGSSHCKPSYVYLRGSTCLSWRTLQTSEELNLLPLLCGVVRRLWYYIKVWDLYMGGIRNTEQQLYAGSLISIMNIGSSPLLHRKSMSLFSYQISKRTLRFLISLLQTEVRYPMTGPLCSVSGDLVTDSGEMFFLFTEVSSSVSATNTPILSIILQATYL